MDCYQPPYGGPASKESGADGKFFEGKRTNGISLFKEPPRWEVYGKLGHIPSQYHAFLCGNLYRGTDGWKTVIQYAEKLRGIEYPVWLIYPSEWDGPQPNPFHSYEEYEEQFLKPILVEVAALRDLLRKYKIGELTEQEMDDAARKLLVSAGVKRGGDRKSEDYKSNANFAIDNNQSVRAESNDVSHYTQRKLDRLAKERPDLLTLVNAREMSVNAAAIKAGFVKQTSELTVAKRAWTRMNEDERGEFLSWISNEFID